MSSLRPQTYFRTLPLSATTGNTSAVLGYHLSGNRDSGIREIFASKIWNPELWNPGSGIQLKESGFPVTIGIMNAIIFV